MRKINMLIYAFLCLIAGIVKAQFTNLFGFGSTNGAIPLTQVVASGNLLFGVASTGGAYGFGVVFSIHTDGTDYKVLHNFNDTDGVEPWGQPTLVGGVLYGMTPLGGTAYNRGTVYAIDTDGSNFRNLYFFTTSTGGAMQGSLRSVGNLLYGMTEIGGANGWGCIFHIDTSGNNFTDILDFNITNGMQPLGSLTISGGTIYGMSTNGGANGFGCVFSVDISGSNYNDLMDFNITNGEFPEGDLTLSGSTLYGMANRGGANGYGTIFSISTTGSNYADMHDFDLTYGKQPFGDLTLIGNTLYGGTGYGGANSDGIIFSIDTNGNNFTDQLDFNGINGKTIYQGAFAYSGGVLYGMTSVGDGIGNIFSVIPPCFLSASIYSHSDATCYGSSTGSAEVIAAGGGLPYTYSWYNGSSVVSTSNPSGNMLSAGTYTVTVSDNISNCSVTASVQINQPDTISVFATTSSITCRGGSNGCAYSFPSGGTPFNNYPYYYFSWVDSTSTVVSTSASDCTFTAGNYSVTVTDANGCSATALVNVGQPSPLTLIPSSSNVSCFGEANGCASVNVSGGTQLHNYPYYNYSWTDSSSAIISTTSTDCGLIAGGYTVTVTDSCGTSATASVIITQPAFLSVSATILSNIGCHGESNGSLIANVSGGTTPYSYSWSPTSATTTTISSLPAGTYSVSVTDFNGCGGTASVTLTQPNSSLSLRDSVALQTNVGCNGGNGGIATIGVKTGSGPYTYQWAPNTCTKATATGLTAGSYTVTVTNKYGCNNTVAVIITQPAQLHDSLVSIQYPACNGGRGDITIGVKGGNPPYSYSWTGGVSTTATATNITSRTYTITIHDRFNCPIAPLIISLTQPNAIRDTIVSSLKVNVSCNGENNGSATVGVKYGTFPYTYAWSPNVSSTNIATNLTAGVYSITVTDKNGCSSSVAKVTIVQPGDLRDSIVGHTCSNSLLRATVGVKGGTVPYTYDWSPGGGTKATMSNLSPGTYTITITDKNNCISVLTSALACPVVLNDGEDKGSLPPCCDEMENINLYPNPNTGQFTVSITNQESGSTNDVEIYNMLGQKVYSQFAIRSSQFAINISDQPNGIYLIRIADKDGNLVSREKVVKIQ